MKKKLLLIIPVVFILAMIACLIPWPIPYCKTLNAVKIDASGKELGTAQITVDGIKYTSVFLGTTLEATFASIEESPDFKINTSKFRTSPFYPYLTQSFVIADTSYEGELIDAIQNDALTNNAYTYHLRTSEDLDCWYIHILQNNEQEIYYVGSFSGSFTSAELYAYFHTTNK